MRKKLLALLLAAALALGLLAGCGGGESVASALLRLLDGRYPNISIEIDPELEADLRQAIRKAEAENAGDDAAVIRAALEKLVGSTVTFRNLRNGQQGDTTFDLVFYSGTDPDKAAQAAYSQWNIVFDNVPDDGKYDTSLAMVETNSGVWMLVKATVEKAGTVDKPDKDDDEPETQEPEPGPTDVGFANDDYSVEWADEANGQKLFKVKTGTGLETWADYVRAGNWNTNCTLTSNITLTREWTPIGTAFGNSYTGTFDGGNHTISGLTVTTDHQYTGLFGFIKGTVKNVVLTEVNITSGTFTSGTFVGGVAGWSFGGNIENCSVSGSVSGSSGSHVGGVVGYQQDGSITGCSSSATVKGTERAGGVVGVTNSGATLTACYATGDVTGSGDTGGVVGGNNGGTVTACYHAGTVQGGSGNTGGAVGVNYATVTACYWSGSVKDKDGKETNAGIGSGSGDATQVTGTNVTWDMAVNGTDGLTGMNAAIPAGCPYKWKPNGTNLPSLTKN